MTQRQSYNLIKLAAAKGVSINYPDIENYFLSDDSLDSRYEAWRQSGDDSTLSVGDPIMDAAIVPLFKGPYALDEDRIMMPAGKDGKRVIVTKDKLDPAVYQKALDAKVNLNPAYIRKAYADYKKALQENRKGEILGGSALAGGAGAVASYVGLGMIPPLQRHKIIRAMLALTAGAGVGYAYHSMANKDIYRNYDWDAFAKKLNRDPETARKLIAAAGKTGDSISSVKPTTTSTPVDKQVQKSTSDFLDRYGRDIGIGTAAGVGTYFLTGAIPYIKDKKLLRALMAIGAGTGAGWLTDVISR